MTREIFSYIDHHDGVAGECAVELFNAAKKIDAGSRVIALVFGTGEKLDNVCQQVASFYPEVWKVDNADLTACINADLVRGLMLNIIPQNSIVVIEHNSFGIDLAPGLSIKQDSSFTADILDIEGIEKNNLKIVRAELGGRVFTDVNCDISTGAVLTVRPGVFQSENSESFSGEIVDKSLEAGQVKVNRKFIEFLEVEEGDVDITKEDFLVSFGRGIGDEDNIPIVQKLAEVMGGMISCSRPIIDLKWMDKCRQVGSSGRTVTPKIYLALGISGSFQHMAGIKGNAFIVAVNKDPKAPIFQYADLGVVEDLLEFVPILTRKLSESLG